MSRGIRSPTRPPGGARTRESAHRYAERTHEPFWSTVKLTVRQRDLLLTLRDGFPGAWVRPMDVGGKDQSHHAKTLAQLVAKGLVERKTRGSNRSYTYRVTPLGRDQNIALRTRKP